MATSNKLILYGVNLSPPTRSVRMLLAELNIDYDYKIVTDFRAPEFLAKNPQHTVPTLQLENGNCIWDSHAIMAYVVGKYEEKDSLYPKNLYQRAIVDQRLHYENGVLFTKVSQHHIRSVFARDSTRAEFDEMIEGLDEYYAMLECFLGDNPYMAGKQLTIADFSIVTTFSAIELLAPLNKSKYPKLTAWFECMKKLPYYGEINNESNKILENMQKEKIAKML